MISLGLGAGLGMRETILLTVNNLQQAKVKKDVLQAADDLSRGMSITEAFFKPNIPISIRNVASVGEKVGKIGDMSRQISEEMVEVIKDDVTVIEQTLPIVMTLVLGIIVAVLLGAFYGSYFGIFNQLMRGT
jgi:type II secretory pathway component PulF